MQRRRSYLKKTKRKKRLGVNYHGAGEGIKFIRDPVYFCSFKSERPVFHFPFFLNPRSKTIHFRPGQPLEFNASSASCRYPPALARKPKFLSSLSASCFCHLPFYSLNSLAREILYSFGIQLKTVRHIWSLSSCWTTPLQIGFYSPRHFRGMVIRFKYARNVKYSRKVMTMW